MKLALLTYNLYYHEAFVDIQKLLSTYNPDIVCFQEMEKTNKSFSDLKDIGYTLASSSNSFSRGKKIFCIATFYKKDKLLLEKSTSIHLPRSYYQILLSFLISNHYPLTVLKTDFKLSGRKKFTVYNVHLSTLATNGVRLNQLTRTFEKLDSETSKSVIVAGDFNYPYRRKKFEEFMKSYGLIEATTNIRFTYEQHILGPFSLKLKNDYIFYKHATIHGTSTINVTYSDHYPVIMQFSI